MGLLDGLFSDDPKQQALMAMAMGLLGGAPNSRKNVGNDIAHAGMLGMGAFTNQRVLQAKLQEEEQQKQMRAMQMQQMRGQQEQQGRIDALASRFQQPGQPQMQPSDYETPSGPPGPGSMDWKGFANALPGTPGINPMMALDVQSKLAAMNQKERVKLGPGETIGSYHGDQFVPSYSAPDKPPAGMTHGPNGLVPDENYVKMQERIGAARRPQITVDNRQENAFASKVGAGFGDEYMKLQTSGAVATGKVNKLDRLSGLLDQSGKTGKFTPNVMELKAAAESLGMKVDAKLPYQQAAQALSNEIALEMRNPSGGAGMPGALSDSDRQFLTNMVPNLAKTPGGNKELIATAKKLANREKEIAALAREYKTKNGKFDEGFYEVLSRYSERNPLFEKASDGWGDMEQAR